MNILLPTLGSQGWVAGVNYIVNLCRALKLAEPSTRVFHFGHINQQLYKDRIPFAGEITKVTSPGCPPGSLFLRLFRRIFFSQRLHPLADGELKTIDVVFQIDEPDLESLFPSLRWIPDFQHVHHPEYFSEEECHQREAWYRESARKATLVVLSSENAMIDFSDRFPEYANKARVLRFVADIPEESLLSKDDSAVRKYNLPDKFFFLPNNFWKHKNHSLVFDAAQLLHQENIDVNIVMTGHTFDYRDASYFDELLNYSARLGISRNLFFLGHVPFEDLLSLQKLCVSLINPSLFEGWSTTVEESKSLGIHVILSDIAVHREQAPKLGHYFRSNDVQSLAEAMRSVWTWPPLMTIDTTELARENRSRQVQFGSDFLSFCREAVELHRRPSGPVVR